MGKIKLQLLLCPISMFSLQQNFWYVKYAYATVNFNTMPNKIPKVIIPSMIHITTKCPEQQAKLASFSLPIPPLYAEPFPTPPSFGGSGDICLDFDSRIGRCDGAPFSPNTILGCGTDGGPLIEYAMLCGICMDPWNDLESI